MLAMGGLLIMVAMGFALSGMISDGTEDETEPTAPDDAPEEQDIAEGSALSDLLFGDAVEAGGDPDAASDPTEDGATGPDVLRLGPGDLATGQDGTDLFAVDATADHGEDVPHITDFESGIDQLVLSLDGMASSQPEVTLDSESTEGMTIVRADGVAVAMLDGTSALSLSDIVFEPAEAEDPTASAEDDASMPPTEASPATDGAALGGTPDDDTLVGGPGDDTLDGFSGDDFLDGGTGDDLLRGREGMDSLFGSGGHDAITGGVGDDVIDGGGENDALFGNEGEDSISGGAGADELYGDEGGDTLSGGAGTDFLAGGEGDDVLSGGAEADMLFGGDGDDSLSGDDGNDALQGGFGADTLDGGAGDDTLDGTYAAGSGPFGPFDEDAGDLLLGGDGDDMILVGANDVATGGEGADTFITGSYVEHVDVAGHVTDFNPALDVIEVIFDPDLTPDPEITVEDFSDDTGANILLDGQIILSVSGAQGLDPALIDLREVAFAEAAQRA
jgi:Ca2+-binding RTX toxin-like protein